MTRPNAPLARSLEEMQTRYDTWLSSDLVMAAALRPHAWRAPGKVFAYLERGREFMTGDFPARFPDMKNELYIHGKKHAVGSETALFDFCHGKHMHVLTGTGLGGGSLINAAVALRPTSACLKKRNGRLKCAKAGNLTKVSSAPIICCARQPMKKPTAISNIKRSKKARRPPVARCITRPWSSALRIRPIQRASIRPPVRNAGIVARVAMLALKTPSI